MRQAETLTQGVNVVRTIYNFCKIHYSLGLEGNVGGHNVIHLARNHQAA
jgi:hypothetical protein